MYFNKKFLGGHLYERNVRNADAERLIAVNQMQVAANHAVPSGAMPFQEVLRVYGEDQITGVGELTPKS